MEDWPAAVRGNAAGLIRPHNPHCGRTIRIAVRAECKLAHLVLTWCAGDSVGTHMDAFRRKARVFFKHTKITSPF